jgi:DNA polymerase sigma
VGVQSLGSLLVDFFHLYGKVQRAGPPLRAV